MTMMIVTSKDNDNDNGNGATGNEVNDDGDCATGDDATGYNDNDDDGGGTTGDEVDDYGKGTTGDNNDDNDDDGNGTERCNNQIEVTVAAGGNNNHRRSTADRDDDEDHDNRSHQDCATGMCALRRGTSTITGSSAIRIASIFGEKRPILCVTEKNTKKATPILVRGLPKSVWVGICQNSKLGSPQTSLGFIPIWGPTYTPPCAWGPWRCSWSPSSTQTICSIHSHVCYLFVW